MAWKYVTGSIVLAALMILSFQNCGGDYFQPSENLLSSSEQGDLSPEDSQSDTQSADNDEGPKESIPPKDENKSPVETASCTQRSPLQAEVKDIGTVFDAAQIGSNFPANGDFTCLPTSLPDTAFRPPARGTAEMRAYVSKWQVYVRNISTLTDTYLRVKDEATKLKLAECALNQIFAIANTGALAEPRDSYIDNQGEYERNWILAGVNLSYNKILTQPKLDAPKVAKIQKWLNESGAIVLDKFDRHIAGRPQNANSNLYWAGVTLVANGLNTDNVARFERGFEYAKMGLTQVSAQGTLPLELGGGSNAFFLHGMALQSLTLLAEIGRLNGIDLYSYNSNALNRLTNLMVASFEDFSRFKKLAPEGNLSYTPDSFLREGKFYLDWMEIHYTRTGDAKVLPYLSLIRPITDWRLGNSTHNRGLPCLE